MKSMYTSNSVMITAAIYILYLPLKVFKKKTAHDADTYIVMIVASSSPANTHTNTL